MSKGIFLTVESNLTGVGCEILLAARRRGYRPVILAADAAKYPFINEHAIESIAINTRDLTAIYNEVRSNTVFRDVKGVYSPLDLYCEQAAIIAKTLGLPGHSPDAVAHLMDKHQVRESLRDLCLDRVPSALETTPRGAVMAAEQIGYPTVLKPRRAAGSFGARLCANSDEVFEQADFILRTPRSLSIDSSGVVVEKAIFGRQFTVTIFDGKAIAVTETVLDPPPFFRLRGMDCPAGLDDSVVKSACGYVERMTSVLGVGWGPLDVEVRVSELDGDVHLIEFNPRLGSDRYLEFFHIALGIDLLTATIDACVGDPPELRCSKEHYASLRFIMRSPEGVPARKIDLPFDAIPEIVRFHVEGSLSAPTNDYRDRVGYAIAVANSLERAISAAEEAVAWSLTA
jgi:biotin carboxylase